MFRIKDKTTLGPPCFSFTKTYFSELDIKYQSILNTYQMWTRFCSEIMKISILMCLCWLWCIFEIFVSGCCLIDRGVAAKKCPISWNLNSLKTRDRIRNLLSEGQLWVAKLSLFQRQLFFINSTAQLLLAKLLLLGNFVNLNKNFGSWANKQRQLYLQIWNKFYTFMWTNN